MFQKDIENAVVLVGDEMKSQIMPGCPYAKNASVLI